MLWSVEVRRYAEDLVTVLSKMREWLDVRRTEPAIFCHTVEGAGVTIHLQFNAEGEAIVFAQTFSGHLM